MSASATAVTSSAMSSCAARHWWVSHRAGGSAWRCCNAAVSPRGRGPASPPPRPLRRRPQRSRLSWRATVLLVCSRPWRSRVCGRGERR